MESQIEASKKNKSGVGASATAKLGEEKEASAEDSREAAAATTLRDNQSGAEEKGKTQGAPVNFNIGCVMSKLIYLFFGST